MKIITSYIFLLLFLFQTVNYFCQLHQPISFSDETIYLKDSISLTVKNSKQKSLVIKIIPTQNGFFSFYLTSISKKDDVNFHVYKCKLNSYIDLTKLKPLRTNLSNYDSLSFVITGLNRLSNLITVFENDKAKFNHHIWANTSECIYLKLDFINSGDLSLQFKGFINELKCFAIPIRDSLKSKLVSNVFYYHSSDTWERAYYNTDLVNGCIKERKKKISNIVILNNKYIPYFISIDSLRINYLDTIFLTRTIENVIYKFQKLIYSENGNLDLQSSELFLDTYINYFNKNNFSVILYTNEADIKYTTLIKKIYDYLHPKLNLNSTITLKELNGINKTLDLYYSVHKKKN
jgi:hypothetical protein